MQVKPEYPSDVKAIAAIILLDARRFGGATYTDNGRTHRPDSSLRGYVVGGNPAHPSRVIPAQWPDAPWGEDRYGGFSVDAVESVAAWLQSMPNTGAGPLTFGVWRDAKGDGSIYLDVVDIIPDRDEAMSLAHDRGDLAIYDPSTGESIETGCRQAGESDSPAVDAPHEWTDSDIPLSNKIAIIALMLLSICSLALC